MKITFIFFLFVILAIPGFTQNETTKIEGAIAGLFNGLSLVDADTLRFYSTDDFHLIEDTEIWNMDTLIHKIMPQKNAGIKRINKFRFLRVEQQGNMAWVSYHNTAEMSRGTAQRKVEWMESAVLVKQKGRWKIQMLHSTPLKKS